MILPLFTPPRDPASTYHNRRLQEVSEGEWTLANSITPGASREPLVVNCIKTCRVLADDPNRGWSGSRQDLVQIVRRRMVP